MTALLGLLTVECVVLGADSRATCGGALVSDHESKIVRAPPWLIACAGEARSYYVLLAAVADLGVALDIWQLGLAMREALKRDGFFAGIPKDAHSGSPDWNGEWMCAGGPTTGVWQLDSSFSPSLLDAGRPVGGGTGQRHAEGACRALLDHGVAPAEAVRRAIEIACQYLPSCGGAIEVECLARSTGHSLPGG